MKKTNGRLSLLDEFVIISSSALLRMLHEYFAIKEYIDPKEWDVSEINWAKALKVKENDEKRELHLIIRYMPECIPFDIRAMFFTDHIEQER